MKHYLIFGSVIILITTGFAIALFFNPFGFFRTREHSNSPIAEFDFELVGGRIYVPAEINGHKTSVILDTGAGASVMDLALANQWGLPSSGELNAKGVGSEPIRGKLLSDVKVSIGSITEEIPYAISLESLNAAEGRCLEIIIGSKFFQKHIVEIDYAKRHLRVFDSETDIKLPGTVLPIDFVDSLPHTTLEMFVGDTAYKLEAMIDTGASGAALTAKFLDEHPLDVVKTEKTIAAGGVGGFIEARLFRPDSIKIDSLSLAKPVTAMIETTSGLEGKEAKYDINVGAELLQRFKVIIDYPHKQIRLEANSNALEPFEADKTGLRIYAESTDLRSFRIVGVLSDSSSENAGIQVDDTIETVDGMPASKFTLSELKELFKSSTAQKWEIGIRRGNNQQLKITIPAKSII